MEDHQVDPSIETGDLSNAFRRVDSVCGSNGSVETKESPYEAAAHPQTVLKARIEDLEERPDQKSSGLRGSTSENGATSSLVCLFPFDFAFSPCKLSEFCYEADLQNILL